MIDRHAVAATIHRQGTDFFLIAGEADAATLGMEEGHSVDWYLADGRVILVVGDQAFSVVKRDRA
jgi:hypothetical protein